MSLLTQWRMSFPAYTIVDRAPGAASARFTGLMALAQKLSKCNNNDTFNTKASTITDWFIKTSGSDDSFCHYVPWSLIPVEVKRLGKSVEQRFYPIFNLMWREVWTNI